MILKNLITQVTTIALTIFFILSSFSHASIGSVSKENKKDILNKIHSLQIPFVENKGQIKDKSVKYYAKTLGGTVYVTKNGQIVYSLHKIETDNNRKGWVLKESFKGGSISNVEGHDKAITKVSYFKGKDPSKWKRNISTYNLVSLGEVCKGIELKLKAHGNNVEKLFYVMPNANPKNIKVRMDGAKGLKVNKEGDLEVKTNMGVVKFTRPVAYQGKDSKRNYVDVAYLVKGNEYGFKVGEYDKTKELVIDPLLASTFLGGTYEDYITCITLDSSGNVYIAGVTDSIDFPITPGVYYTTYTSGAFISKFDNNLKNILASTFLDVGNRVNSIAIDASGNIFIAGATGNSTDFRKETDFFFTATSWNGTSSTAFVSKLDGNLQNLLASRVLQGSGGKEIATALSIDSNGNVYVTGMTNSANFPVTAGANDTTHNGGGWDVFISKFDSGLQNLVASTFLGGSKGPDASVNDYAFYLSIDNNGNIYVVGATASSDFPVSTDAYDKILNGSLDVFISKFDSNLGNLLASTFLGGSYEDYGMALSIDSVGNIYVTGVTFSVDFPTNPIAYDGTYNGFEDVFIAKFDSNLKNLISSTYLGGSEQWGGDKPYSIALDLSGNVYVAGSTHSSDFPITPNAYDTKLSPGRDSAFISKLSNNFENLLASTFLGSNQNTIGSDKAFSMILDSSTLST
jgi:hypothetical protein